MPEEALNEPIPSDDREPCHPLSAEKPTIKILLYTDAPNLFTLNPDNEFFFGLAPMVVHLLAHAPAFAGVSVRWESRYSADNPPQLKRINTVLEDELCETGKPFDEIWVFGLHNISKEKFSRGLVFGGPDSDLNDDEVLALRNWMCGRGGHPGGGVLMMGDHSEPARAQRLVNKEQTVCPDTSTSETLFGLGRGLGRCVPRAGRLRVWDGGPPRNSIDTHDTVNISGTQGDPHPQQLFLKWFDETGEPSPGGQPHPLFFYRQGSLIEVFPDHMHEGAVVIPTVAPNDKEWPEGPSLRPLPRTVARGLNRRKCELIDIVAAYDGDAARVGRIVADSTWHHYTSINLHTFMHPAPVDSAADKIGQYYGNLAVWLAPRALRREMAYAMIWWLANHPVMLEEVGGDELAVGQVAYSILVAEASPCEIHELLLAIVPDRIRDGFETLYFPESSLVLSELPSKELILGSVVNAYHEEIIKAENKAEDSDGPHELRTKAQVAEAGVEAAFERQRNRLTGVALAAQKFAKPQA